MEDAQNSQNQTSEQGFNQGSASGVSFPVVNPEKKSGGAKTFLIIGILILVGILGFVIFKSASDSASPISVEPTPIDNLTTTNTNPDPTPEPTPEETSTPVDKSEVTIEVQNGTGISGEAAYLQTQLKNLGYTDIDVGNASSQSETSTTVTYSKDLSDAVMAEITEKLKSIYSDVKVKTSSSTTTDVVIVTGLRKGATTKPAATTSPTSSPQASASPSPSPSN